MRCPSIGIASMSSEDDPLCSDMSRSSGFNQKFPALFTDEDRGALRLADISLESSIVRFTESDELGETPKLPIEASKSSPDRPLGSGTEVTQDETRQEEKPNTGITFGKEMVY
jgi:hypothetical protein